MRASRTLLNFALAVGCTIPFQGTAFSQEYRGTWEQQRACTPDVWRLCGAQIPDVDRIVATQYSATQRWVPRGVCTKRCALTS